MVTKTDTFKECEVWAIAIYSQFLFLTSLLGHRTFPGRMLTIQVVRSTDRNRLVSPTKTLWTEESFDLIDFCDIV